MGGGSDDGGYNPAMFQQATPYPGVPVAGSSGKTGNGNADGSDPYNYGKYQSFLPGPGGGSAMGLTDDMFTYRTPNEILHPGSTPPAAMQTPAAAQPAPPGARGYWGSLTGSPSGQALRDQLAHLHGWGAWQQQQQPTPAPTTPPPTTPTTSETPAWMSYSMTG